ncbi:hypothetical protein SLEP1_g54261 [Rubroshorea leprosula]|uniref:Disease resistance RPP13-like protein 1 n=1 Tax=Rubroshorea leprosula TaxID=152421 RepID=A0AAV5MCT0_9ROSI|nr:hypothetical protein SLEP1_g54261 [Rubroshorea leprosula]
MEVLSLVGGSLLFATFDLLLKKLDGYLSGQLRNSKEEVRVQVESWKTLLLKIITVLKYVEDNQVNKQFVESCFDDLRNLAYDMEDLLEEFAIDATRSKLIAKSKASTSKGQKVKSSLKSLFRSQAKPNGQSNSMVNHLNVILQRIVREMSIFGLSDLAMGADISSRKDAFRYESEFLRDPMCGRDSDKRAILDRLLEDGGTLEQDFVIPIVGMGGLGKTTLARLIYNDEKLNGRFDLKAWVCVFNMFDVAQITEWILEVVTKERHELENFALLQEKLKVELSGHKFLLVLDDVWDMEYGQWDVLKRPFMSGALGSKIIVTTRNMNVGKMMRGDDGVYNLELLQDDACWPLFTQSALGIGNFDVHPKLQDVGEKLVKRCNRLPLALKTLGGVLQGKLYREEWENVLNSEIWRSSNDNRGIFPTLRLSYNCLPVHLKRCFAYCALFPKGYEVDKEKLVLLWMAEGLLQQQSHEKKQLEEEIGHQYFKELLSRSLFQQSSGVQSQFIMHDLLKDLAVDIAGEIYYNLELSMGDEKLKKARHWSFTPKCHFDLSNQILHDFLPSLKCLRVLSLCGYKISKLPDCFENLKYIRYIDLSGTRINCIPESVGSLLFLQTLLLSGCGELAKFPTTIGNLIDLYYLDITDTPSLKGMPLGISNLKNLVKLSTFIVGEASGMMRLSDLKYLSQLQGRLSIVNLKNVLDVQDAKEADLDKIHGLEKLVLEWTTSNNDRDELVPEIQVLNWLKPHSNLKSFKISCYGGKTFPNWVCDPLLFLNLSSMELSNCKRCTLLPSLGLLPVLEKLIIKGMWAIKAIGSEFYGGQDCFPSLEELVFENMLNWKEWTSPTGSEGEFPFLRRLVIKNCPKLGQLPNKLSSLKELDVRGCNVMVLKSMGDCILLASLKIEKISGLT